MFLCSVKIPRQDVGGVQGETETQEVRRSEGKELSHQIAFKALLSLICF